MILFSVFLLPFLEHTHVAEITALADLPVLHGLNDGTSRLVDMGTVIKTAISRPLEYLREIMGYFRFLHVDHPERADTGCIHDIAPELNGNISAKVVVCFPVSWDSEISATFSCNPGSTRLINEDFPTPDRPEKTVTLSFNAATTSSIPSPVSEETCKHSYPASMYTRVKAPNIIRSSSPYKSILLNTSTAGIRYASTEARKRSIKTVDVTG